ncbi:lipocalin family protein [Ornithobacterium rhinotracheale]|uniref:lipocalin family protein n=1 Tax=Ornithobacterium rhinotracheale TaxID=28251 RepID=UPI001FF1D979|nr:lipocalin family protein [Ornithobacterium rhinotracheale]MCK0204452.1 hypothetical protein [Ornithobacterium rhinotracheale]
MKKLILPVVLCTLFAISCSRDDDGNKPVVESPIEKFESLIVGKWHFSAKQIIKSSNGETVDLNLEEDKSKCFSKWYDEFFKDGKYISHQYFKEDNTENCEEQIWETTYTLDQAKSIVEIKGLAYPIGYIQKLNKDELVIKFLGDDFDGDDKKDYRIYTYKRIDK